MERKIGEIFEYNGEWYQCVKSPDGSCKHCDMNFGGKCPIPIKECVASSRSDLSYVIFKKLEKVGEPFTIVGKLHQHYKVFDIDNVYGDVFWCVHNYKAKILTIEIKQNKEDMEECGDNRFEVIEKAKKHLLSSTNIESRKEEMKVLDNFLFRCWQMGWLKQYEDAEEKKLKSFNLEAAKSGKPVCTRDGRKARIICFDSKNDPRRPIVALVEHNDNELLYEYTIEGKERFSHISTTGTSDLLMLPEKKEGWVNVYRDCDGVNITKDDNIYSSKDAAIASAQIIDRDNYVATTIIKWEE